MSARYGWNQGQNNLRQLIAELEDQIKREGRMISAQAGQRASIQSDCNRYGKALREIQDACFGILSKGEVENFVYDTAKAALDA
jgi:hypothetical protein